MAEEMSRRGEDGYEWALSSEDTISLQLVGPLRMLMKRLDPEPERQLIDGLKDFWTSQLTHSMNSAAITGPGGGWTLTQASRQRRV